MVALLKSTALTAPYLSVPNILSSCFLSQLEGCTVFIPRPWGWTSQAPQSVAGVHLN